MTKVRLIDFQAEKLLTELSVSQVPAYREAVLYDGGRWTVMRVDWCVVGDGFEADVFVNRFMTDERARVHEEVASG